MQVCQKLRVVVGISVVEGVGEEFLSTGSNEHGLWDALVFRKVRERDVGHACMHAGPHEVA